MRTMNGYTVQPILESTGKSNNKKKAFSLAMTTLWHHIMMILGPNKRQVYALQKNVWLCRLKMTSLTMTRFFRIM